MGCTPVFCPDWSTTSLNDLPLLLALHVCWPSAVPVPYHNLLKSFWRSIQTQDRFRNVYTFFATLNWFFLLSTSQFPMQTLVHILQQCFASFEFLWDISRNCTHFWMDLELIKVGENIRNKDDKIKYFYFMHLYFHENKKWSYHILWKSKCLEIRMLLMKWFDLIMRDCTLHRKWNLVINLEVFLLLIK